MKRLLFMSALLLAICTCVLEAGVATSASSPASAPVEEFTFVLAGDPQIGGWTDVESSKERFVGLAKKVNAIKPAFVLVAGDIVNAGTDKRQLSAAQEALKEFHMPTHLVPGNHDDLATFNKLFGKDYYSFTWGNSEFVCINSNLLNGTGLRAEAKDEWAWLAKTLADAKAAGRDHVFLLTHHTPVTMPLAKARLEQLIRDNGVDFVLAGHVHRTVEEKHEGYMLYTVSGSGWSMDRRGLGYRIFRVNGKKVEQEYVRLSDNPSTAPALSQPTQSAPAGSAGSAATPP